MNASGFPCGSLTGGSTSFGTSNGYYCSDTKGASVILVEQHWNDDGDDRRVDGEDIATAHANRTGNTNIIYTDDWVVVFPSNQRGQSGAKNFKRYLNGADG